MANINYERISPNDDADATQRRLELEESLRKELFPEAHEDKQALAEITISADDKEIVCTISDHEAPIPFSPTRLQITTASPVGKYVAEHLDEITVGTKLPNGATIINIGYIRSRS